VGKRAVLIAGPTASGKSRLALEKARALGGVVVNADALQVYDGLRLVTARPDDAAMAEAPHRLYGVVSPTTRFSTGDWLRAARKEIDAAGERSLIFVGGTGLYFEALTNGIAEVPEVPAAALAAAENEVRGLNRDERRRLIAARDPEIAARLKAPDPQRVIRALAVLNATGRSLARFQDEAQRGALDGYAVERLVLNPDRTILRQRIHDRFLSMLDHGAVDEVRALVSFGLDPTLPICKAIGVREIGDFLAERTDRDTMIDRAVIATRQYAKRQRTWFRGRMADWTWIES
jgi:tRNA dimethylallyltransferase